MSPGSRNGCNYGSTIIKIDRENPDPRKDKSRCVLTCGLRKPCCFPVVVPVSGSLACVQGNQGLGTEWCPGKDCACHCFALPTLRGDRRSRKSPLYIHTVRADDCHGAVGNGRPSRRPLVTATIQWCARAVPRLYNSPRSSVRVSPPHFIVEISGIAEIVELETRKSCLATHALGNFGIEPQRAKPGATRLRHRRRHAGEQ